MSYPYSRLVTDRLWQLADVPGLFDACGNVRQGIARQRDTPAGFGPDVLATFERSPELVDVAALHLLERHFAPGLHEEILEAVGLELSTPLATRRRAAGFRAAVVEAYLAECCVCGFSLRLLDHGAFTVGEDLGVRMAWSVAGSSARALLEETDGREIRLPVDWQLHPNPVHSSWHRAEVFEGRHRLPTGDRRLSSRATTSDGRGPTRTRGAWAMASYYLAGAEGEPASSSNKY